MNPLARRLADRIRREGPISFRDFMEAALYDPGDGYYATRAAIGEGGDFVTSPTISPLFARAIARTFAADAANYSGEIGFLEAAAGTGRFLADFQSALQELAPDVRNRTRLLALERTEAGRLAIARAVPEAAVLADPGEAGAPFAGWVFSNELYDALPVHRVQMREGRLLELAVDAQPGLPSPEAGEGGPEGPGEAGRAEAVATGPGVRSAPEVSSTFVWTSRPAPPALSDYFARFGIRLENGQTAEVNLEAAPLHRRLCGLLSAGRVLAFDYGHRASVLYHPHARPSGTLAVHSGGRRGGDPLEDPGRVDLTAHVNWDGLVEAGREAGFETESVLRQSRFLLEAGLFEDAPRSRLEALRLFDPEGLGDALSVMIQSRGVPRLRFFSQLTTPA